MKLKQFVPAILATAALLSAGLATNAQTNNYPPPDEHHRYGMTPGERLDRLGQELGLSDEQKTNVQAAFDDMRQRVEEARTNLDSQLQGILTPEQYQKFQNMREEKMHHWKNHSNGSSGQ